MSVLLLFPVQRLLWRSYIEIIPRFICPVLLTNHTSLLWLLNFVTHPDLGKQFIDQCIPRKRPKASCYNIVLKFLLLLEAFWGVVRRLLIAHLITIRSSKHANNLQIRRGVALHRNICPEIFFNHLKGYLSDFWRAKFQAIQRISTFINKRFVRGTFFD